MGRNPCFHCHWPAFNPWSSRKPSSVTKGKKKKNKKELLIALLFFYSRKIDEGSGI